MRVKERKNGRMIVGNDFARQNREGMLFLFVSVEDYVACRCCLLNGLLGGFQLGAQAVEKALKACLLLKNDILLKTHRLSELAQELSEKAYLDLTPYMTTITVLEQCYNRRYPDNWRDSFGISTDYLKEVDRLFFHLMDTMPVPEEVKIRTPYFAYLFSNFNNNARDRLRGAHWMTVCNDSIQQNRDKILELYKKYSFKE